MANDFLSQILASVLGSEAPGQQGSSGSLGGLGGMLGSVLGRTTTGGADGEGEVASPLGGKGALLAMLLPLAMQMIQRNGGVGALLEKFKQQGYGQQAGSWVSTGANQAVTADAVTNVVGADEVSRMVLEEVLAAEGVLAAPEPAVSFTPGMLLTHLQLAAAFSVADYSRQGPVAADVRLRIYRRLRKEGVPLPHLEIR